MDFDRLREESVRSITVSGIRALDMQLRLKYVGIPSVTVGAPTFIAQIHSTGVNRGVPVLRTAEYPGAFASHSEEELRRHTRETVWPQIVSALTEPILQEEIDRYAAAGKRPFDEAVYTGTLEEVQEFC